MTTSFDLPRVRALVSRAVPRSRSDGVQPTPDLVAESPRSAEPVAVAPESPVGARLMRERVQRGLTLAECEAHLHIRAKFLAAIEDGRDEDLPEPAYARIFARSYASFLQLDARAIARERDQRTGDIGWWDHETVDAAPRTAGRLDEVVVVTAAWCRSPRCRTGRIVVAVALALSVLIWLGYRAESGTAPSSPTPVSLGPVNIPPSSPVPAGSTHLPGVRPAKHAVSTRTP